ncbi:MAG TPA: hypothetical protein VGG14_19675 [Candidatus Sulfotelmatobacter sp.]
MTSSISQGIFFRMLRGAFFFALLSAASAFAQTNITTYHYDNYRTGWNSNENILTPNAVHGATFGIQKMVAVDDEVDAQPLVVNKVKILTGNFRGLHNVVYVATDNNSVYAIDTTSGAILLQANFGPPVVRPLNCGKYNPDVGIKSTPVIDPTSNILYVMVYTNTSSGPAYYLHALALGTLKDTVAPKLVTASHTLSNGTTYSFQATYQQQRPALLLTNGAVYASFGSFCDFDADVSRGWLLGWQTGTLTPLAGTELTDTQATDPDDYFLTSIWMSGYGPAVDDEGNVLLVTANSDKDGLTYDGVTNVQESVVKVSSDLTTLLDIFTPDNVADMDEHDLDFGAGGVLVLPDQPGAFPHLAVAAGKLGTMFFMDEDALGGYNPTSNNVLGTYTIGPCWCGETYFVDPKDGAGRVVSSGGNNIIVWKVLTSPTPALSKVSSSVNLDAADTGFFTSVSSNGTATPIIWGLSRPSGTITNISLFAFQPDVGGTTMQTLYKGVVGTWPANASNTNLIPVVANGKVFIGSYKELVIMGLTPKGGAE